MNKIPLIVSTEWLEEHLNDPKLRVIDATTFMKPLQDGGITLSSGKDSYNVGHIPGAVYADLLHDLSNPGSNLPFTLPERDAFVHHMENLGIGDKDTYTVIYDQGALVGVSVEAPQWAARLRWQLTYEGFENIAVLEGGLQKWKEEGRPLSNATDVYPKADFKGERKKEMLATMEDVIKAMDDDSVILINSLSPEDFKGETDTYPRKGHIPGSVNVFFGCHANPETKTILPNEELKKNFEKTGPLDSDKRVITYCGGGIAATWNALVLEQIGVKNIAVYDGSLNEWASREDLPLVTGSK
ncbi:sulfurtransferase [Pradoshia eiseniae]|uniref:Sulfurtransferase n=2 Tax=Pradoshia eiseniae TaxID=2064768 RepID=A0A2S7N5H6_9BACI|nr:sulfurtransferase [Pradoshia eiseniae]PQD97284.1 sulfurtransferase [Pradoshia eiseniae]